VRDVDTGSWLEIASLGRMRGLHGEIFAVGSQLPEWYTALAAVRIRLAGGNWFGSSPDAAAADVKISAARLYSGRLALRFEGIETAEAARPLVNGTVFLSRAARPPAPDGEIWLSDLVGCRVEDVRTGRDVGRVTGWQDFAGPAVTLEVTPAHGGPPALVPYVRAICIEVDLAARRIRIDPPEGLLELNAAPASAGGKAEAQPVPPVPAGEGSVGNGLAQAGRDEASLAGESLVGNELAEAGRNEERPAGDDLIGNGLAQAGRDEERPEGESAAEQE
jgi:16S rRNA processing protein RimM